MVWQNKKPSVFFSYAEHFWWARVDYASRASKKAPQGNVIKLRKNN
jgi:hypothetical protein